MAGRTARWCCARVTPTPWWTGMKSPCRRLSAGRPGPIGIVDIALVQVAVHDAVQAIDQQFEPYHAEIDASARRTGQRSPLRCHCRGGARRARRHLPRAGGNPRHDVLQLPGGQGARRRSRDPRRTAGCRAYSSAAPREPESSAATFCRWNRRWHLAADAVVPGKSARTGAFLADGDAVDGRL